MGHSHSNSETERMWLTAVCTLALVPYINARSSEVHRSRAELLKEIEELLTRDAPASVPGCSFPFTYNGVEYNKCTAVDNDGMLWCATTDTFQTDFEWKSCSVQEVMQDRPAQPQPGITPLVLAGLAKRPVRVGAFNVQVFGDRKFAKEEVVSSLLKILPRYDILLFQEIRDATEDAFPALITKLNAENPDRFEFEYVISERLGRSSSKEQYAYVYRKDLFTVEATYQYPDPSYSKYERPPYAVIFNSPDTALERIGFIGVHTKPSAAEQEIDSLVDVYNEFSSQFQLKDVVMMGDFNAGCSYVTRGEWPHVRLRTDDKYEWLFGDDADTTVAGSSCPYDRAVVAGKKMKSVIVPGSAEVYRFDDDQGLTQEQTEGVSDHFPIDFLIYGKVDDEVIYQLEVANTVSIEGTNYIDLYSGFEDVEATLGQLGYPYEEIGDDSYYLVTMEDQTEPVETLKMLNQQAPGLLPDVLYYSAITYLQSAGAAKKTPAFPGIKASDDDTYTVTLEIDLTADTGRTSINVSKKSKCTLEYVCRYMYIYIQN